MRHLKALLIGLSLVSASAHAAALEFTPYAGHTTVNMTTVNQSLKSSETMLGLISMMSSTPLDYTNKTQITGAWIVGADVLSGSLSPWESLSLGLRTEYLQTNLGQITTHSAAMPISFNYELWGNLTDVLLGGRYQIPGKWAGFDLSAGLFMGVGYAEMHEAMGAIGFRNLYHGQGFVGDLDLRLNWAPESFTHLRFNTQLGYRYASFGQLYNEAGEPLRPGVSNLLAMAGPATPKAGGMDVDFSGLTIGGGFSLSF